MPGTQESVRDADGPSALQAEIDAIVNGTPTARCPHPRSPRMCATGAPRAVKLRPRAHARALRAGTHAGLAAELQKHMQARDARITSAERKRDEQVRNTNAIFDGEEKLVDDSFHDMLDSVRMRLLDQVYAKYGKPNPHAPTPLAEVAPPRRERKRASLHHATWIASAAAQRRRLLPPVHVRYSLNEAEIEADLERLLSEVEKVKSLREQEHAPAADEGEDGDALEVSYDRARNSITIGDVCYDRWAPVTIAERAGSSLSGDWCITALSPVEVTLRNAEGTRTKVRRARLHATPPLTQAAPPWPRTPDRTESARARSPPVNARAGVARSAAQPTTCAHATGRVMALALPAPN